MKTSEIVMLGGAGLAAYFLLAKPNTSPINTGTTFNTGSTGNSLVGLNSGVKGGNGSFCTVSNYNQLLAAVPNLGNPSYSMTDAEASQYVANYSDLQQGLPSWLNVKQPDGTTPTTLNQAARSHWKFYGCAEKRIYLPLQPPSTAAFIPPPQNSQAKPSGSSSTLSTILGVATTVLGFLGENDGQLNNADVQMLFTMSAVIKDILPLYEPKDPLLTRAIEAKMNVLLNQYS